MTDAIQDQKERLRQKQQHKQVTRKKPRRKLFTKNTRPQSYNAHKKHVISSMITSRLSIGLLSLIIGIGGTLHYTSLSTEDSLDGVATGDTQKESIGRVIDNTVIFPEPPSPQKDTLPNAHIGAHNINSTPQDSLAIGDSTVSWGDGTRIATVPNTTCGIERGTWAHQLGIDNIGCAGKTTKEIKGIITKNTKIIKEKKFFYITAGSNDIRSKDTSGLDKGIDTIVSTITTINPQARIIFVGYLPAYIDKTCMGVKDRNSTRRLHDYHKKANYAMKDAAIRYNSSFIDVFHEPYQPCSKDTFIKTPRSTAQGHPWHTTTAGHSIIAGRISSYTFNEESKKIFNAKNSGREMDDRRKPSGKHLLEDNRK